MKIKSLTLYTKYIDLQTKFYEDILEFELLSKSKEEASFKVGNSILSFKSSVLDFKYHYCFLIPSNKLDESITWLSSRLELIKIDGENVIQDFKSWNAHSIYFYDATGNVVEFIVRHDLKNDVSASFNQSQIISINEIGMVSKHIRFLNRTLEKQLNTKFWKGDLIRFGTNGNQDGLFLLVNNLLKKNWYPTNARTESSPFEAQVEVDRNIFNLAFQEGNVTILRSN